MALNMILMTRLQSFISMTVLSMVNVPFFSTGVIQRKNFYKEAGLASYGDYAVLCKKYLAVLTIKNIKDAAKN